MEITDMDIKQPFLNADIYRSASLKAKNLQCEYLHIHKDGTALAGFSDLTGRIWDGMVKLTNRIQPLLKPTDQELASFDLSYGTACGCFSDDSDRVVICGDNGSLGVWKKSEKTSWQSVWQCESYVSEHDDIVTDVAYLFGTTEVITTSADTKIKTWDLSDNIMCTNTILAAHDHIITGLSVQKNNNIFITSSLDLTVSLWDKRTSMRVNVSETFDCGVRCVTWLDEDRALLGTESGELYLINKSNFKPLKLLTFFAPIHKIIINNQYVSVCCDNNVVTVYKFDAEMLDLLYENSSFHKDFVRAVAWDGLEENIIYSVSRENNCVIKHLF